MPAPFAPPLDPLMLPDDVGLMMGLMTLPDELIPDEPEDGEFGAVDPE